VRRFTLITIVVLFALIVAAAIWQLVLADSDRPRFPGPAPGTPLPSVSPRA
jgi:hypothetical protein